MRRSFGKSLASGTLAAGLVLGLGSPLAVAQVAASRPSATYYYTAAAATAAPAAAGYYYYPQVNAARAPGYYYYPSPGTSTPPPGVYYFTAAPPVAAPAPRPAGPAAPVQRRGVFGVPRTTRSAAQPGDADEYAYKS